MDRDAAYTYYKKGTTPYGTSPDQLNYHFLPIQRSHVKNSAYESMFHFSGSRWCRNSYLTAKHYGVGGGCNENGDSCSSGDINTNNANIADHPRNGRLYELPVNGTDKGLTLYMEEGPAMIPRSKRDDTKQWEYNHNPCHWAWDNRGTVSNAWGDQNRRNMYSLGSNVFVRKSTNKNCELPKVKEQPPVKEPVPSRSVCDKACWPPEEDNCEVVNGTAVCLNGAWERGYEAPPVGPKNYPDPTVVGCGWKLVRRLPERTTNGAYRNYFHQADDFLRGTHVYGKYEDNAHSKKPFSMHYSSLKFDQFLFATSNGTQWGIMSKEEVFRREWDNMPRGGYIQSGYYPAEINGGDRDYYGHHYWQHWLKSSVKNSPYKAFTHVGGGEGCRSGKFTLKHHSLNTHAECKDDEVANYYSKFGFKYYFHQLLVNGSWVNFWSGAKIRSVRNVKSFIF